MTSASNGKLATGEHSKPKGRDKLKEHVARLDDELENEESSGEDKEVENEEKPLALERKRQSMEEAKDEL